MQAPRAWYDRLGTYHLKYEFIKGVVDNTLFVLKFDNNILSMQIYIDDIIFGATMNNFCHKFEKMMQDEFDMFMMDQLKYFLRFHVKQSKDGIFIIKKIYNNELI